MSIVVCFTLTRMLFPLLLGELCVLRALGVKSSSVVLRFMARLLLRREASHPFLRRNRVIVFFWQHANHCHHSHHSRAPIMIKAVCFRLFHHFVHSHFHLPVIWKCQHFF